MRSEPTSAEWAAFAASRNLLEMEVVRIRRALQQAEELNDDVRAALERVL